MRGSNILLVTDDCESGRFWSYATTTRGATVTTVAIDDKLCDRLQECQVDIIVMVALHDDCKGIEIARRLRQTSVAPFLLLMPRYDEALILRAYEYGIDDCIISPVSPAVFVAKISAWLRHIVTPNWLSSATPENTTVSLPTVKRNTIVISGKRIRLTNLEQRLFSLLQMHRGQILESDQIVNLVWGYPEVGDSEMLKSLIYRLRNKIEPDPHNPQIILTIPGEGYTFVNASL